MLNAFSCHFIFSFYFWTFFFFLSCIFNSSSYFYPFYYHYCSFILVLYHASVIILLFNTLYSSFYSTCYSLLFRFFPPFSFFFILRLFLLLHRSLGPVVFALSRSAFRFGCVIIHTCFPRYRISICDKIKVSILFPCPCVEVRECVWVSFSTIQINYD